MSGAVELLPINQKQMQIDRAEFDTQIATAKRYPRETGACVREAIAMVQENEETAQACIYALPRGGKTIKGKSIALAQTLANCWGNIRIGARLMEVGETTVEVVGICHDLEKNTRADVTITRRITDKNGKRYNDDMIAVTCNAAASIAIRNAIFRVIPSIYAERVYNAAIETALGKQMPISERRTKAVDHFKKLGIDEKLLLGYLKRAKVEDITGEDLETLFGLANAIKSEEASIDEVINAAKQNLGDIDTSDVNRGELIASVLEKLSDIGDQATRDELVATMRKEMKEKNNEWRNWATAAILRLEDALNATNAA